MPAVSIYRGNIQPYCSLLYTSLPALTTITGGEALNDLYQHISEQQTAHPDAFFILAGDFNHADLKSVFPKIQQHVDFQQGKKYAGLCLHHQRGAYKALPLPHLGASDHITVMLMPAHRPLVKVIKTNTQADTSVAGRVVRGTSRLFRHHWLEYVKQAATYNNTTDLQEYSETVTAYITKCIDDVTVTKTITVRANQKPWLTGEVYRLLKARNAAFRAGDEEGLRTARANLSRGIREAKRQYSRRIAHRFSDSRDTRSLWQGIQTITDYKPPPQTCDSTIPLLNELNAFFARFWGTKQHHCTEDSTSSRRPDDDAVPATAWGDPSAGFNARKAPGPWQHSWACTERLCSGTHWCLHRHFQHLTKPGCCPHMLSKLPPSFRPEEVISILLNDYRPVALTPILMKCFERFSHAAHQVCPPPLPGPLPVCI